MRLMRTQFKGEIETDTIGIIAYRWSTAHFCYAWCSPDAKGQNPTGKSLSAVSWPTSSGGNKWVLLATAGAWEDASMIVSNLDVNDLLNCDISFLTNRLLKRMYVIDCVCKTASMWFLYETMNHAFLFFVFRLCLWRRSGDDISFILYLKFNHLFGYYWMTKSYTLYL